MSKKLIKEITLAVFITASCNLALDRYNDYLRYVELERYYQETGVFISSCTFGPRSDLVARFYIELCLIVTLIAGRLKRLWDTLFSIIGLSCAVIIYLYWWQLYFRVMEVSGSGPDAIENYAYLVHGTFIDVAIAGGVALLVVLNVIDDAASSFRLERD